MEHSTRGREVTDAVSTWITNDGDHFDYVRSYAAQFEPVTFGRIVSGILKSSPRGSAAWHTAQDLSPNDYGRIDWASIARELRGE